MRSNPLRGAIIELHKQAKKPANIAKQLNMNESTVRDAIKRYKELGTLSDRVGRGRKRSVRTPRMREVIRRRINRNSGVSMRKMAKSLDIDEKSVRTIVHLDLGLKSYKIAKCHHLNDKMKLNRLQKAKILLRKFAQGRHRNIVFTDEKIFTVERQHNHQNDRQLLKPGSKNREAVTRSHHPASVMVWAGVTATGKTPLIFIEKGVKIDQNVYQELLKDRVAPWAIEHFGNNNWTFQQDWAPSHGAKKTIELCQQIFPSMLTKDEWPSNSPDLNPMDYSVWSILEARACAKPHTSIDSLKKSLKQAWNQISTEELTAIVDNFPKRLKACIKAKGGHFENEIS